MSANEWDRQSEVLDAVSQSERNDIPATVIVLEQWSDENTFYIFNDSTYTPKSGGEALGYNDFTFSEKWPNPKAMTDSIHESGMKLLLWQVPVLKHTDYSWEQKDIDEAYMIEQGYAVGDGQGGQYRTPTGSWFGDSLLLDFTNQEAVDWWMSKAAYCLMTLALMASKLMAERWSGAAMCHSPMAAMVRRCVMLIPMPISKDIMTFLHLKRARG